ncbi:MAG: hypothetical protein HY445_02305 [Candidatus Niyogibacteria bacterium]|nr:hypothetical protein [Candidatus Niyogibacteria bacterium]
MSINKEWPLIEEEFRKRLESLYAYPKSKDGTILIPVGPPYPYDYYDGSLVKETERWFQYFYNLSYNLSNYSFLGAEPEIVIPDGGYRDSHLRKFIIRPGGFN